MGDRTAPPRVVRLWESRVADGATRPVTETAVTVRDFAWSPAGDAFAVITDDDEEANETRGKRLMIIDGQTGRVRRTLSDRASGPGTRNQTLDWSPDGRLIAFAAIEPGTIGHWLGIVDVNGATPRELFKEHEGTVMRAAWTSDSRHLIAQTFEGTRSVLRRIDTVTGESAGIGETLDAYPDFSTSRDGSILAYASSRAHSPADVWVLSGGRERQLTRFHPQMAGLALGRVQEIEWKSSVDGETIRGVLVTPPGYRTDRRYPTILHIHGGPHFHWHRGWLGSWEEWAQLLASHGYVSLLPNPRGSTGRSWPYARAIRKDLGGIDLKDLLDGVDALVANGTADPDRLGVGGWSYGGFMTAWTITQTRRFKAAVVGAGISDLFSFAGTPGNGPGWQSYFPDVFVRIPAEYDRRSAVRHLEGVTTATLILHGERDQKISVTQGWELYHGLRALKVPSELVVYPREGHGMTERAHRLDMLERVLAWFDRYLAPTSSTERLTPRHRESHRPDAHAAR